MGMPRHLFRYLLLAFLFAGCAVTPPLVPQKQVQQLSSLLQSLDASIPNGEANILAGDIFYETQKLTKEFELTSPPVWHNFLVNTGVREKGLCYEWSDALYAHLSSGNYPSFEFHLFGANIGEYFSEHNALVVAAKGGVAKDGIVIDPWRNSGTLYFSKVNEDRSYQWKHRPDRGCP
jgi:hypothetical protein